MSYDEPNQKKSVAWVFVLGCGGIAAIGLVAIGLACVWFLQVIEDPEGVVITIEGPDTVAEGEEFSLTVVVKNERETDAFELTDIDIAEEYLAGFLILGTDPPAMSTSHIPIDNTQSFTFNESIPAQSSMEFEIQLQPVQTGLFRGDIDVCEGQQFLTTFAQTNVVAGEPME